MRIVATLESMRCLRGMMAECQHSEERNARFYFLRSPLALAGGPTATFGTQPPLRATS